MAILANKQHALGREKFYFAKKETTFATVAVPAGTDAVRVLNSQFSFTRIRDNRADARATRSLLERITGKREASWSVELYILPSGSLGVAPDAGPLFEAAMGIETVNAATSVVYSLSPTQNMPSLQLYEVMIARQGVALANSNIGILSQLLVGAYVEKMTISLSGGEQPKVSFEGTASDYALTGVGTLTSSPAGAATFTINTDETVNFLPRDTIAGAAHNDSGLTKVGSLVDIRNETTGALIAGTDGKIVTDVNGDTITVSAVVTATTGNLLTPMVPASVTTTGNPVAGILGSLTLQDSESPASTITMPVTSFDVSVTNGTKALTDEAFQQAMTDFIPGYREVTGTLSFRARRDIIKMLAQRKQFNTKALVVTIGDTAGKKLTISVPRAELEFSDVSVPEADEALLTLPWRAISSSETAEDEISLTFE